MRLPSGIVLFVGYIFVVLVICYSNCSNFKFTTSTTKKITYYFGSPKYFTIRCNTSSPAEISWQKCSALSKSIVYCDEISAKDHHNTLNCVPVLATDTELRSQVISDKVSLLSLRKQPMYTGIGCFQCVAMSKNTSQVIKQSTEYSYQDYCHTPTKAEAKENPEFTARSLIGTRATIANATAEFNISCKVAPVEKISIRQSVRSDGNIDAIATWQHNNLLGGSLIRVYGFCVKVTSPLTSHVSDVGKCFYDLNNQKNIYTYNLSRVTNIYAHTDYKLEVEALPVSSPVHHSFRIKSATELCEKYFEENGVIPLKCQMVKNITVSHCAFNKSVNISWIVPNFTNIKDLTFIQVYSDSFLNEELPKSQSLITLENVDVDTTVYITLKLADDSEIYLHSARVDLAPCPNMTTTTTTSTPTTSPTRRSSILQHKWMLVIIILSVLIFSVALIAFLIYFCATNLRKGRIPRTNLTTPPENYPLNEPGETVMLVYPHGCREVENIVLFLAAQLNSFGIEVLVDNLQTERVAKYGLPFVLMKDFKDSNYVITLCTESETSNLASHRPYNFVMNQLVSTDCVFQNGRRCIAVYFSKTPDLVPTYLRQRCYSLPLSFERFVQHLLGIQTFFSSVHEKMFNLKVGYVADRKKELRILIQSLNMAEHGLCNSATCRKGQKTGDEDVEFPLTETFEKEAKKQHFNQDDCSLKFSSTESLTEDESSPQKTNLNDGAEYYTSIKPPVYYDQDIHHYPPKNDCQSVSSEKMLMSQLSRIDEMEPLV